MRGRTEEGVEGNTGEKEEGREEEVGPRRRNEHGDAQDQRRELPP